MYRSIRTHLIALLTAILSTVVVVPANAQSYQEVTMSVGETKTLYLPSSVTSKNLKSVSFYSNGISYVQVTSYNNYSVTVKAIKAFSSTIIVRCDYRYFVNSGSYTYEASGAYDFRIKVAGGGSGGSGIEPTSITFPSSAKAISVGESVQLTPIVQPSNAEYTLTWSINDQSVATISQDGLLVGRSKGAADLKVMANNGIYAMLRVVVSDPAPTSVSISPSAVTLTEGESRYLSATVSPSNASQSVSWTSSNSSVVSVSSSGKITALKAGSATIKATTYNGATGTCSVTCNAATKDIVLSDKNGVAELPGKANVTYERVFRSGWNSVCVPFALSKSTLSAFCDNCKIATVERLEIVGSARVLSVREVQSVKAGEPCFVYVPQDVTCTFNLSSVTLSPSPQNSDKVCGAYQRTIIGANHYKLTEDGKSLGVTKTDAAIVAPFRAYIEPDEVIPGQSAAECIQITVTQ